MKNASLFKNDDYWSSTNIITMWIYEFALPSLKLNAVSETMRERERWERSVREKLIPRVRSSFFSNFTKIWRQETLFKKKWGKTHFSTKFGSSIWQNPRGKIVNTNFIDDKNKLVDMFE